MSLCSSVLRPASYTRRSAIAEKAHHAWIRVLQVRELVRERVCIRPADSDLDSNTRVVVDCRSSIENESTPIQLAQCFLPGLVMIKYKHIFQIKYTEAISPNSTRKLLWFEISIMLIAVRKIFYCVIYYNFLHTFVPYCRNTTVLCLLVYSPYL